MFNTTGTTAWLSGVSRRKLQSASAPDRPKDADKLLRRVLLRNSLSRVDLALAEVAHAQSTSTADSIPQLSRLAPTSDALDDIATPPSSPVDLLSPERSLVGDFVFPDASSMTGSRTYTVEETEAEARWLDSLLENLSDDDEYEDVHATVAQVDSDEDEEEDEDSGHERSEQDDLMDAECLAWLLSTTAEDDRPPVSVPSPTSVPVRSLSPPRSSSRPDAAEVMSPFPYPLPDDSDDDYISAPGMEDDVEGEDSEADSLEWPATPGSPFRSTASLGRSVSNSSLHNLVASATPPTASVLPAIHEGAVYQPGLGQTAPRIRLQSNDGSHQPHPFVSRERRLSASSNASSPPSGNCC